MDSSGTTSDQEGRSAGHAFDAFAQKLRETATARFGPGPDEQIVARMLDFFQIAPGKAPKPDTFAKWWRGESFPPWQQAVQIAILVGDWGDWLIFPDATLPRHADLARALFFSATKARKLPADTNILTWLNDRLMARGQQVTRSTLANWVAGHSAPTAQSRAFLEDIFAMRPGDLQDPRLYMMRIDPVRFKKMEKASEPIKVTPAAKDARPPARATARKSKSKTRSQPRFRFGGIIEKALKAVPGLSEIPKTQRLYLQKELMNRYVLNISLATIHGWLEGRIVPEPDAAQAISEILKIANLPLPAVRKAAAPKAEPAKPAPEIKVAEPKPSPVLKNAAKVAPEAKTPALRQTPAPKKSKVTNPVPMQISQGFSTMADAPRDPAAQVRFLKAALRDRFSIKVKNADVKEWMEGTVTPKPAQLSAILEILQP